MSSHCSHTWKVSPEDWKENPAAFAKWAREVHVPSFAEYAKYPDTTGVEVVKALKVKQAHSQVQ